MNHFIEVIAVTYLLILPFLLLNHALRTVCQTTVPVFFCELRLFVQICLFSHNIIVSPDARNRAKLLYQHVKKQKDLAGQTSFDPIFRD